jgi:hypothetical protein
MELYRFGINTFAVLYGNPLMLSKMVGPNFVVTHSTLMIGYFLSTSIVLILIACLEAAA